MKTTQQKPAPASVAGGPKPWEQQPDESSRAFAAFRLYLSLGEQRSVPAVARARAKSGQYGKTGSLSRLKDWAAKHVWQERLRAWLAYQAEVEQAALDEQAKKRAVIWAEREQAFRERRFNLGQKLLQRAEDMLKHTLTRRSKKSKRGQTIIEPTEWNIGQAARLAEAGDKLTSLSLGIATDSQEVSGKDGTPIVPAAVGKVVLYLPEKDALPEEEPAKAKGKG